MGHVRRGNRCPFQGAHKGRPYGREVRGYGFPLPAFAGTGFAGTTRANLNYRD